MKPMLEVRDLLVCRENRPVVEVDQLSVEAVGQIGFNPRQPFAVF